jgi:hypothetical protein
MIVNSDFWRDLEIQFRALGSTSTGNRLEARYGGEDGGHWVLCGPLSKDPGTMDAFAALAKRASVATGMPAGVNYWLDLLRSESGLYRRTTISIWYSRLVPDDPAARRALRVSKRMPRRVPMEQEVEAGSIPDVILASALLCMDRATRAFHSGHIVTTAKSGSVKPDDNADARVEDESTEGRTVGTSKLPTDDALSVPEAVADDERLRHPRGSKRKPDLDRGKERRKWMDSRRPGWSLLDWSQHTRLAYETLKKYRDGITTTRTPYVRNRISAAEHIEFSTVPE